MLISSAKSIEFCWYDDQPWLANDSRSEFASSEVLPITGLCREVSVWAQWTDTCLGWEQLATCPLTPFGDSFIDAPTSLPILGAKDWGVGEKGRWKL